MGVGVGTCTHKARLPRFQRACPSTALDKLKKAIQLYAAETIIYAHRAQIPRGDPVLRSFGLRIGRFTRDYLRSVSAWAEAHPTSKLRCASRADGVAVVGWASAHADHSFGAFEYFLATHGLRGSPLRLVNAF